MTDYPHLPGGYHAEPKVQVLDLSATMEQLALYVTPVVTGLRQAMEKLGAAWEAARPQVTLDASHPWYAHITMERKPRSRQRQLLEAARYDLWYAWDRGARKYGLDRIRAAAKEDARTARVLGPVKVTGTWAKSGS